MTDLYDRMRAGGAGFDLGAVDALVDRARREIDAGLLPSCQLALARDGEVIVDVTLGDARPDDRYVIFSCTKALTAAAIWMLLGEGRLRLDERVAHLVPAFGTNGKDVVTVEQLLTHTAGFPMAPLGPPEWSSREARLDLFRNWRLTWEPGTRFEYHATSAHWVLAELIEQITGVDYRRWIRDQVVAPLQLRSLQLGAPDGEPIEVRPVAIVGDPPSPDEIEAAIGMSVDLDDMLGEVTDAAKQIFSDPDVVAVGVPAGGAVSTAADVARLYQAFLHNPDAMWDDEVLRLGTATILCDLPDPLRGIPANRTLGLILAGDDGNAAQRGFGHTVSPAAFGHDGAGGQIAWADPATGLSFCYLTDGHDRHLIREWRRTTGIASRAAVCVAKPS